MRLKNEQIRDEIKQLRALMRDKFGAGKYRIEADGRVSVYGNAPNSIVTCWWLYAGDTNEALHRLTGEWPASMGD